MNTANRSDPTATRPRLASPRLLRLDEVAESISTTRRFVELEIARGRLAAARLSPRCIRVRSQDLDRYIDRALAR
jgi:excisionase family DNA binding protein